jgi:hypothetical protein
MRVGSTYGVGGFAMIEARESGESSIAGGADTDTRPVGGYVGEDTGADTGTGLAEDGKEAVARFSPFDTGRGIGTGKEVGGVDCNFLTPSPGAAREVVATELVIVAAPFGADIKADSDSNFGTSNKTGLEGGTGGGSGLSLF